MNAGTIMHTPINHNSTPQVQSQPPVRAFVSREQTVQTLKHLIRLNNEGASLLRSSVIKGRDAMALFQTALRSAVDLAESCQEDDLLGDCNSYVGEGERCELSNQATATTSSGVIQDLCLLAPVPIPTNNVDYNVFYFLTQVVYLNPAGLERAVHPPQGSHQGSHARGGCGDSGLSLRSLSRLYVAVLLLNASLACYQLGHACLLQPFSSATSSYTNKAHGLFGKSMELYSQLISLTESDFFVGMKETSATSLVSFLSLAAANNNCLLCLEMGLSEQSRHSQSKLLSLLQSIRGAGEGSAASAAVWNSYSIVPTGHRELIKEFLLNSTLMNVTGFHTRLAAGAA